MGYCPFLALGRDPGMVSRLAEPARGSGLAGQARGRAGCER